MQHIILAEFSKFRKNKMVLTGFLSVVCVPILFLLKSLFIDSGRISWQEWTLSNFTVLFLILPIMSSILITYSVEKEYEEKTIINIITAPTKRSYLILSKIVVWFCWYLITLLAAELLLILGAFCLYGSAFDTQAVWLTLSRFTGTGLLSFAAFLPVIWIAVRQRTLFYPSVLAALVFTALQAAGSQIAEELLPFASLVPWMAVGIMRILTSQNIYFYVCIFSILLFGILGIFLAVRELKHQDL